MQKGQFAVRYLLLLVVLTLVIPVDAQSTVTGTDRVVTISPPGESYIDPEILPGGQLLAYQSRGNIYLARLNPETGMFVSDEGKDILIDTGATRPIETFNGPEFGIDSDGVALYYTKPDDEQPQIWRAMLDANLTPEVEPVTAGARFQTQLVSRNPDGATTRIAAIRGTWQNGTAVWLDESDPMTINEISPVEVGVNPVRWVDNSYLLTSSERTGANRGQIALIDTTTGSRQLITDDTGAKTDPYGWFAPDAGGDLLVLAIVDNAAVAVYRDTGGETWDRIATLSPPANSQFGFVASAEPFVVNGKSYISLIIKDATGSRQRFTDSEVWLFGLETDGTPAYTERCDSGEAGLSRTDPEVFAGANNIFVYYNVMQGEGVTPYEIRRCRSNLTTTGDSDDTPVSATPLQPVPAGTQPPTSTEAPCVWIDPAQTDPDIDTALEPHYVCHDTTVPSRDTLMVFFPGTGGHPAHYTRFVQEGASMGMHTIGLRYPNDRSVNLQYCPRDPDPNCHANVRREVIYGGDHHSDLEITPPNTIVNRLVQLLRYLDVQQPDADWEQYLNGDTPRWDRIIVAGHSQGAGMAGFIAHEQRVLRAVLFGWVDQSRGQVAPWITEAHVTPGERIFTFEHVEDRKRGEAAKLAMFDAFGLDRSLEVNVDEAAPPYQGSHILLTEITPAHTGIRPSSGAHNVVVVDAYTPIASTGPVLSKVWQYLLDAGS